jgi:hypothetical protein
MGVLNISVDAMAKPMLSAKNQMEAAKTIGSLRLIPLHLMIGVRFLGADKLSDTCCACLAVSFESAAR